MLTRKERAARENFTIYMLMGWKRFVKRFMKAPLSSAALHHLNDSIDYAIADIKQSQAARAERRSRTH